MKAIHILYIILICFSCSQQRSHDPIGRFNHAYEIKAKRLPVDTYKLNSFGKLILFEEQECLIKQNYLGESLLDIIYYKKDSVIPFVQIGNGPDEYLTPIPLQKVNPSTINILERQKMEIDTKSLSGERLQYIKLDKTVLTILDTKNGYIASGLLDRTSDDKKRYSLFDKTGKYILSFGEFPDDQNESTNIKSKILAYQDLMVYNEALNRFVSTTQSGAIFELYQLENAPLLLKQYIDILPLYKDNSQGAYNSITHDEDNRIGYIDLYATKQYIYALYSGKKVQTKDNAGMLDALQSNSILVYNWDGDCIALLKSDIPLFNICVTEDDQELIALGWNNDYRLYSFRIPTLL